MQPMKTLIAAAMLLSLATAAGADTLLDNPGYETGDVAPWDHRQFVDPQNPAPVPDAQRWTISQENPHSGNYCAVGWGSNYIFCQEPVVADWRQITEFSFWYRQDDPQGTMADLLLDIKFDDFDDTKPGMGLLTGIQVDSTGWFHYDGLAELQKFAARVERILDSEVVLTSIGVMGTFNTQTYVDDWVLTTPEPTSLALLGFGACILLRRRRA